MIGNLPKKEIEEVLVSQIVGRIGCHGDGLTYIVPISYGYCDGCVFALTEEGMKLDIMRQNPKVCFQVDVMKDMANWKSVIAWGEFEELIDPEERERGLRVLVDRSLPFISSVTTHLTPTWPFVDKHLNTIKGVVFKIRLEEKTGRFENSWKEARVPQKE